MAEHYSNTCCTSMITSFPTVSTGTIIDPYNTIDEQSNTGREMLTVDCQRMFQVLADLEIEAGHDPLGELSTSIWPVDKVLCEFDNQIDREEKAKNAHDDQHYSHSEQPFLDFGCLLEAKGVYVDAKRLKASTHDPESEHTCSHDDKPLRELKGKKLTSERSRRERINGKVKALQELIPNCYKRDQASILDDAVKYIQSLKLQRDILSNGQTQLILQGPPYATPQIMPMAMRPRFGQLYQMSPSGYALMVPPSVQIPSLPQAQAQAQIAVQPALCPPVPYVQVSLPFAPSHLQQAK